MGLSPPSAPELVLGAAQLEGPVPGAGGSHPGRKGSPSWGQGRGLGEPAGLFLSPGGGAGPEPPGGSPQTVGVGLGCTRDLLPVPS